ncbi:2-hydroxyacid dehydrogenase [Nesterenkonia alba]|uniref:2-hydroxyacid dehydrogenase n=1 Tax=Nesterenkonia alba TaxID=515814 RepID=UPI00041218EF|nr:D-glycerate dehydrogenase [Nesterenkonia alba]
MSHEPLVYLSRELPAEIVDRLRNDTGAQVRMYHRADFPPTREELLKDVSGAHALVTMLTDRIDAEVLEAAGDQLQVVANFAVGFDNIDLHACRERGVTVTNTPGVLDESVADLTLALILAVARRVPEADRFMRTGSTWIWNPQGYVGMDVSAGRTLGIIGLGRIGMAVARRAHAFGMQILASGRGAQSPHAQQLGVTAATPEDVITGSDILSLHCPLTTENKHMIAAAQLESMKPGSILINTARGPLVDEAALAEALASGHLGGAGLDVFEDEPNVHPRLRELDNVVLLPHIGSAGDATRRQMAELVIRNVAAVLQGQPPVTEVTL